MLRLRSRRSAAGAVVSAQQGSLADGAEGCLEGLAEKFGFDAAGIGHVMGKMTGLPRHAAFHRRDDIRIADQDGARPVLQSPFDQSLPLHRPFAAAEQDERIDFRIWAWVVTQEGNIVVFQFFCAEFGRRHGAPFVLRVLGKRMQHDLAA